jgi:transposase-like protein
MNQKKESTQQAKNLNHVIKIDEAQIHSHLDEMVRDTVEETINKMPDAEADKLCNAKRYEHTESRTDTRVGSYRRKLETEAGVVNLKVPRLRKATLETVIIERYRRRESSFEETLIQMYLAGVSVRRIEDIKRPSPWAGQGKEITRLRELYSKMCARFLTLPGHVWWYFQKKLKIF